jgi:hypothetical protein
MPGIGVQREVGPVIGCAGPGVPTESPKSGSAPKRWAARRRYGVLGCWQRSFLWFRGVAGDCEAPPARLWLRGDGPRRILPLMLANLFMDGALGPRKRSGVKPQSRERI